MEDDAETTESTTEKSTETREEETIAQLEAAIENGTDWSSANTQEDVAVVQLAEPGRDTPVTVKSPVVEVSAHSTGDSNGSQAVVDNTGNSADGAIAKATSSDTQADVEASTVVELPPTEEPAAIFEPSLTAHIATLGNSSDVADVTSNEAPNGHASSLKNDEVDVEALQQRLKLVEQRFARMYPLDIC